MMKKILGCALCFFVLISCLTFNSVNALDDVFPYEVYCSNNQPSIGSIITIRVARTDYKNATKKMKKCKKRYAAFCGVSCKKR